MEGALPLFCTTTMTRFSWWLSAFFPTACQCGSTTAPGLLITAAARSFSFLLSPLLGKSLFCRDRASFPSFAGPSRRSEPDGASPEEDATPTRGPLSL